MLTQMLAFDWMKLHQSECAFDSGLFHNPDHIFSSGIPKSKSHFSKLKKAYNETTSKVSTVVQQGFRASGHNQTRGIELSCPPIIAHKDAILDISSSEARTGIFASTSMDKTAKIWVSRNLRKLFTENLERVWTMFYKIYWSSRRC